MMKKLRNQTYRCYQVVADYNGHPKRHPSRCGNKSSSFFETAKRIFVVNVNITCFKYSILIDIHKFCRYGRLEIGSSQDGYIHGLSGSPLPLL
ncbi:hypothetical protein Trydic_g5275 [Trypoxylus dichotomus]